MDLNFPPSGPLPFLLPIAPFAPAAVPAPLLERAHYSNSRRSSLPKTGFDSLHISTPLDAWVRSQLAMPCLNCGTVNSNVNDPDISIEGITVTLRRTCSHLPCSTQSTHSNLSQERLLLERPPDRLAALEKARPRNRKRQRMSRGWSEDDADLIAATEQPTKLRDTDGRGILQSNLRASSAILLTGMTLSQQQQRAAFTSHLTMPKRTVTAHAPHVWYAAEGESAKACAKHVLSKKREEHIQVCVDGGWDHPRDGNHNELAVLDATTGMPYLVVAMAKDRWGSDSTGRPIKRRVGNYHKDHSNGMEGDAWKVNARVRIVFNSDLILT